MSKPLNGTCADRLYKSKLLIFPFRLSQVLLIYSCQNGSTLLPPPILLGGVVSFLFTLMEAD